MLPSLGKTPYKRLGCFQDKKGASRPLPELLFDASANVSQLAGPSWNAYLLQLVCKCAEETKLKMYTHFGLQDYGKCYSGPAVSKTFGKVCPCLDFMFSLHFFALCPLFIHKVCPV